MKFEFTLFLSDEEKHGHHLELPLFLKMMSEQFLAPGGLTAMLSVFKLVSFNLVHPGSWL